MYTHLLTLQLGKSVEKSLVSDLILRDNNGFIQ